MGPEFQLIREFDGPVLGICFGHQLMALAEDYRSERTDFGGLRINNMRHPETDYLVVPISMRAPFRFLTASELWVQHNHRQEVTLNEPLRQFFEVIAGSDRCPVGMMQHKTREWYGVQFHPEIGRTSQRGEVGRHQDAVRDGQLLMQNFVRYCVK
jgi:GMP synthase (glutamine-hydrolysing)